MHLSALSDFALGAHGCGLKAGPRVRILRAPVFLHPLDHQEVRFAAVLRHQLLTGAASSLLEKELSMAPSPALLASSLPWGPDPEFMQAPTC